MISTSNEFNQIIQQRRNFVNYADITLADGTVLHLLPENFCIGGNTITDNVSDGDKFTIGNAIAKYITMRIINNQDQYSDYDFYNARIVFYVALPLSDSIEKLLKGYYTVNVPETSGSIIEITAVDDMVLFDRDYAESTTTYPATLQTILSDACTDCGVTIGFGQFDNYQFTVANKPTDCTYRQVIAWVAQIAGYNARMSVDNALQLIWYDFSVFGTDGLIGGGDFETWVHDTTINGGDFTTWEHDVTLSGGTFDDMKKFHNLCDVKSSKFDTDDVVITGINVITDEASYSSGTLDYAITIEDNQLAYGWEQTVANFLGNKFIGMKFRPFSASAFADPRIEAGDVAYAMDYKGNVYQVFIPNVTFTTGSYTEVSCNAESPIKNKSRYYSDATKAVAIARKNAEKQMSTYDRAVQSMNELAMNALGYYEAYEDQTDGSRITYSSSKPITKDSSGHCIFANGSTVFKRTSSGFFVSTDGGDSFTAGFDSHGNAVLNILDAIGIRCNWISGGILTLGGLDNINGKIEMFDSNGNIIATLNKDGIDVKKGSIKGASITLGGNGNIDGYLSILSNSGIEIGRLDKDGLVISDLSGNIVAQMDSNGVVVNNGTFRGIVNANELNINTSGKLSIDSNNYYDNHIKIGYNGGNAYTEMKGSYFLIQSGLDSNGRDKYFQLLDSKFQGSGPKYNSSGEYVRTESFSLTQIGFLHTGINHTTGTGKTVMVNSDGVIGSASSSMRYKTDIKDVEDEVLNPHALYKIPVKQFKYKEDYLSNSDERYHKNIIGFIAEFVDRYYPIGAIHDSDGNVEMWDINTMFPAAIALIQEQHEEIEQLKTELAELKDTVNQLIQKVGA